MRRWFGAGAVGPLGRSPNGILRPFMTAGRPSCAMRTGGSGLGASAGWCAVPLRVPWVSVRWTCRDGRARRPRVRLANGWAAAGLIIGLLCGCSARDVDEGKGWVGDGCVAAVVDAVAVGCSACGVGCADGGSALVGRAGRYALVKERVRVAGRAGMAGEECESAVRAVFALALVGCSSGESFDEEDARECYAGVERGSGFLCVVRPAVGAGGTVGAEVVWAEVLGWVERVRRELLSSSTSGDLGDWLASGVALAVLGGTAFSACEQGIGAGPRGRSLFPVVASGKE